MYRHWDKKIAQKYLLFSLAILVFGFIITTIFVLALVDSGHFAIDLSIPKTICFSFLIALVPLFSFTGFSVAFLTMELLTKKQQILIVLFCIPVVLLCIPFGAVMIIPTIIKCIKILNMSN